MSRIGYEALSRAQSDLNTGSGSRRAPKQADSPEAESRRGESEENVPRFPRQTQSFLNDAPNMRQSDQTEDSASGHDIGFHKSVAPTNHAKGARSLIVRPRHHFQSGERQIVPDDLSALHHKFDSLQFRDVGYRVAGHGDQIGVLALLDRADLVLPSHGLGVNHRAALDSPYRG